MDVILTHQMLVLQVAAPVRELRVARGVGDQLVADMMILSQGRRFVGQLKPTKRYIVR